MKKRLFALLLALVMLCMAMPLGVLAEEAPEESDNYFPFDGESGDNDVSFGDISGCKDGHNWGEWEVTEEATCTTAGERKHICTRCQKIETEEIPAAHKLTKTDAVEATCGKAGNSEYYTCSVCGKYFDDAEGEHEIEKDSWIIPATGNHTYGEWKSADENNHTHTCTVCESAETELHTWDEGVVTTEPTETAAGLKTYTCTLCKATKTETIPATGDGDNDFPYGDISGCKDGHNWGEWEVTEEATCTTAGERKHTCTRCQKIETEEIPAAHKLVKTDAVEATCGKDGNSAYYTCATCGKYFDDAEGEHEIEKDSWIIPAAGEHNWSKWTSVDTDNHTHTCSVCGKSETEAHAWDNGKVTTNPTCTAPGVKTYTCSVCSDTKTEEIPADGHKLTKTDAVEATCGKDGNSAYYTCATCGKYFDDAEGEHEIEKDSWIIPAAGEHNWSKWTSVDTDNHTHTCSVCGKSETEAHAWDNGKVTTNPTCTEAGVKTYTCSVCSDTKTEEIPADGHKLTKTDAVEATCGKAGNSAYYTCATCGKYFDDAEGKHEIEKDSWIIPATGKHTYGEWKSADEKNHTHTCTVCESVETELHTWDEGKVTTEPTETAAGLKTYTCALCKATKTETIPATGDGDNDFPYGDISGCKDGHDGEWTVETDATCTTPGKKTRTCTRCGMVETVTVDALGHKLTKTEAKAATCLENGNLEYYTCSVCHKVFKDAEGKEAYGENEWVIAATGNHSWSEWTPVEGEDQHTRTCSACNETETKDHSWGEGEITKPATETEPGEKTFTCSDCGATKKEEIPPTGQVIKGDVNGDGEVDEEDVDLLLMYIIFGADEYPVNQSCDFDGSGVVDEGDVDYLLMYVIFGGEEYPLH